MGCGRGSRFWGCGRGIGVEVAGHGFWGCDRRLGVEVVVEGQELYVGIRGARVFEFLVEG